MGERDILPTCPRCKRKLSEVDAREEDGPEPRLVTCPHCGADFDLREAIESSGQRVTDKIAKDFQRKLDKIVKGR